MRRVGSRLALAQEEAVAQAEEMARTIPLEALGRLNTYEGSPDDQAVSSFSWLILPLSGRICDTIPARWAPNLVSLMALFVVVVASVNLVVIQEPGANPNGRHNLHACSRSYVAFGISVLVHLVLDTAARQMSRRPGTNVALNDVFRQSCNAVAVTSMVLGALVAMRLGSTTSLCVGLTSALTACYLNQWQKYVTGEPRPPTRITITEIQLGLSMIALVPGLMGPEVWQFELLAGWHINEILFTLIMVRTVATILGYWDVICEGGPGEENMSAANTGVLEPAPALVLMFLTAYKFSTLEVTATMPHVALLSLGMVSAKITLRLFLAHVTKSPIPITKSDLVLLLTMAMFVNGTFGIGVPEPWLVTSHVAVATASYCVYCFKVFHEISSYTRRGVFLAIADP